ncbi:uncharacterized protein LOC131360525 [Hemibagrus wyckioides]|uniref:uncharacterized protein LOC131360525 n=1 Tax=Hemibagrus wyckioides TaxID=337641 RepID=UPI00266CE820|nr:uncharacterized protein LOC131360525 [Hemibagrus wyckioides]
MNKAGVFFVDEIRKAEAVIASKVVIRDTLANVLPLGTPAKKVTLSNVPPYISDDVLNKQLSRFDKLVSPIKMIPAGYKDPELRHIVSYRRHVYMILNNRDEDLNIMFKIKNDKDSDQINDKQDSGGNSAQTTGQEKNKQQESNAEGQEAVKNTEQETNQMETEKENPQANVSECTEQDTQLTESQSNVECSASENTDMIVDDAGFTLVRSKRKSRAGNSGPQTRKKGLAKMENEKLAINSEEPETKSSSDDDMNAETESDEEQNNDEQTDGYEAKEIKCFLQKTKNMTGVRVDQYFPDKQNFVNSATVIIKEKNKDFTHQEIFRLKKFVTRTRQDLLCEDEESV